MSDAKSEPQKNGDGISENVDRERRVRVLKKGKIVFQRGLRSIPCLIRDLSESGAKLEFDQPYMLPEEFVLQIDLQDYEVSCKRRWIEGLQCGAEFVGEKRRIAQMRAQTLKTSEEALKEEEDDFADSTSNFFKRRQDVEPRRIVKAAKPSDQPPRPRSGKSTFGKRR
ncbi:MAG: PilZ domain-containing protein [Roseibium sp.]|uniref:PilZ domain-containing protein n=1 Tax=Roseibium sp. TaxID=1936156 RepID=UPI0026123607|nr:PilZ domain-containing protein [Roseibium sp.]MCV0428159.1 PilZ domain-containing protein [Roseibium sp.]